MAAKDADVASEYASRSLFMSQVTAEYEILEPATGVNQPNVGELFMVEVGLSAIPDTTPPVISNVDPAPGTQLPNRSAALTLDITDIDPGVQVVILTVKYATRPETQVVYNGSDFITPFNSAGSQVTAITNGYRFQITPENQWLGDIEQFFVYAIDIAGNVEGLP